MVKLLEEYGYPSREIVVRDARGERRLGVYGEFRGKLIVRNLETNRLSYIRPNDPRIQQEKP